jgi:uncharacterized protein (DUF1330 family)
MPVYVLAQLRIHDRARYDRYAAAFMPVLIQYGGRLLASDESPQVLEGRWDREKAVLIRFEDRAAAERWMTSPEYREISKDREAGSEAVVLMLEGFAK